MLLKLLPGSKPGKSPLPVDDPPVGFLSSGDALILAGVIKEELTVAREMADLSPSWLAQAQALERILPVLQGAEIIVIE
jgi:hypothetical protein